MVLVVVVRMVINYSKWDNLEVSSDEEEGAGPVVHRLDPSSGEELRYGNLTVRSKSTEAEVVGSKEGNPSSTTRVEAKVAEESGSSSERTSGAGLDLLCKNGARCEGYLWSQDRGTCTVSVLLPSGARAKDVSVHLLDRGTEFGTKCARKLLVEHSASGTRVEGRLRHPCGCDDDDLVSHWEIRDLRGSADGARVLAVELRKLAPAQGVVRWWRTLFEDKGEAEVDVGAIEERGEARGGGSFAEVWETAHREVFGKKTV